MRSKYSGEELKALAKVKKFGLTELQFLTKTNDKKLKELSKIFAIRGRVNSRARIYEQGLAGRFFEFISDYSDMEKARNEIWHPDFEYYPTWSQMDDKFDQLYNGSGDYLGLGYYEKFKELKLLALEISDRDNDILNSFELAAERYLRHLEILNNCLVEWIKTYEADKECTHANAQYGHLQYFIQRLQNEIDDFNRHLGHCYRHFSERFLQEPLPEESLEDILANLHDSYTAAYQSMNVLWRLIKPFFQRSERDQEIEFLANLSKTVGCTDALRMRAIALVHNKIFENETFGSAGFFGSGSRLREILDDIYAQKEETVDMSGEDDLFEFIETHNLVMPPELAAYYETVRPQALTI